MSNKRTPPAGGSEESTDTQAFRAAMRGVTPLQSPPRHDPEPKRRLRKPRPVSDALENIDEAMPLIAAAAAEDTGAAALTFQRGGVRDAGLAEAGRVAALGGQRGGRIRGRTGA